MGFPPSGSGQIHPLASLTPESRKEIERKLFDPIPPIENAFYEEYRNRLSVTFDLNRQAFYDKSDDEDNFHPREIVPVNPNTTAINVRSTEPPTTKEIRIKLTWRHFHILFNSRTRPETIEKNSEGDKSRMRETTSIEVVEAYIRMIYRHANRLRPPRKLETPEERKTQLMTRTREARSCTMIRQSGYELISTTIDIKPSDAVKAIEKVTLNGSITRDNFMSWDFIFIPHLEQESHYTMWGIEGIIPTSIAPKRREVFVLDSVYMGEFLDDNKNLENLLAILNYLVPDEKDREQWDLNFDYVSSDLEQSKVVHQRDSYDCGIFACTNAILLAFGYDLLCYGPRDMDKFRKRRMVAEFRNGGFTGLYNYDLIELPPPKQPSGPTETYKKALEAHEGHAREEAEAEAYLASGSLDGHSDDSEESDNDEVEQSNQNIDGEAEQSSQNNDDFEARGLEDTQSTASGVMAKTTSLPPRPIFPTASQCLARDITVSVVRPDSIDRPMPAQFSPANKRYRFMYSFPHINFDEAIKCSKEEMIEACKNFPVANWEKWSEFPKDFFLRWMMTEMGATMSRIHKDPIQPCPGLGDGYQTWLQWQDEGVKVKENEELAKELKDRIKKDAKNLETSTIKKAVRVLEVLRKTRKSPRKAAGKRLADQDLPVVSKRTRRGPSKTSAKKSVPIKAVSEDTIIVETVSASARNKQSRSKSSRASRRARGDMFKSRGN